MTRVVRLYLIVYRLFQNTNVPATDHDLMGIFQLLNRITTTHMSLTIIYALDPRKLT
jgi:hypothetical protein